MAGSAYRTNCFASYLCHMEEIAFEALLDQAGRYRLKGCRRFELPPRTPAIGSSSISSPRASDRTSLDRMNQARDARAYLEAVMTLHRALVAAAHVPVLDAMRPSAEMSSGRAGLPKPARGSSVGKVRETAWSACQLGLPR